MASGGSIVGIFVGRLPHTPYKFCTGLQPNCYWDVPQVHEKAEEREILSNTESSVLSAVNRKFSLQFLAM